VLRAVAFISLVVALAVCAVLLLGRGSLHGGLHRVCPNCFQPKTTTIQVGVP
jgi:hypothetical protein